MTLCLCLPLKAQKQEKCSEQEFRAKKEAYMTEKASLTPEEAGQFFPLYFELQDIKKKLNGEPWGKARKADESQADDAEYEALLNHFIDAQQKSIDLDREYLKKYLKFLSPKKIYLLRKAEGKFHRNILRIMQQQDHKKKGL